MSDLHPFPTTITTANLVNAAAINQATQMKKHEIFLDFTETEKESISENCKCEFCGEKIRFYRHKKRINDGDYHIQNTDKSRHRCYRSIGWSEFGVGGIPEGWEYRDSDDDDDRACFTIKKYSRFDK